MRTRHDYSMTALPARSPRPPQLATGGRSSREGPLAPSEDFSLGFQCPSLKQMWQCHSPRQCPHSASVPHNPCHLSPSSSVIPDVMLPGTRVPLHQQRVFSRHALWTPGVCGLTQTTASGRAQPPGAGRVMGQNDPQATVPSSLSLCG